MKHCPSCGTTVGDEEKVCGNCGTPIVSDLQEAATRKPASTEPGPRQEHREEPASYNASQSAEPPRPREAGTSQIGSDTGSRRFEGEAELEAFLAQGYEIYLIAGIAGVGKSEFLSAFQQDGFLEGFRKMNGMVIPTALHTINCHPIRFDGRKILFVDAAGENFRLLYPDASSKVEVTENDIRFLKLITGRLRGVILLVELERLWDERMHADHPENAEQVRILAWILSLLRWLTVGRNNKRDERIRFVKQVDADLRSMGKRLKVPVEVLYSKADQLVRYPIPRQATRTLSPNGEDPLVFTYHCLRSLYNAVDQHADHYRFDFVHSLVTRKGAGMIIEHDPCGVALAIDWLLDGSWNSRLPKISTRRWVSLQRAFDKTLGRGRRWTHLLPPKEIRA